MFSVPVFRKDFDIKEESVFFRVVTILPNFAMDEAWRRPLGGVAACWIKPATPNREKRMTETFAAAANLARLRGR
jgi:hypothetical protein